LRKIKSNVHVFILITIMMQIPGGAGAKNYSERDYVEARTRGDIRNELKITEAMIHDVKYPLEMEVLMWRIYECSRHFSYIDTCLQLLRTCEKNEIASSFPLLKDRARHLRKRLLLLSGEADKAMEIRNSLGAIIDYTLTDVNTGREAIVTATPSGIIDVGSLTGEEESRIFVLEATVSSERKRKRTFAIGSTGHMSVRINGTKVLHDPDSHGFCEDQHLVQVMLNRGKNLVKVKMRSDRDGASIFTMRIPAHVSNGSLPNERTNPAEAAPLEKFYTGYCLYWLGYANRGQMRSLFMDAAELKLAPALCHYYSGSGSSCVSDDLQHIYLAATMAMPEALMEYARRLAGCNLIEPALSMIHTRRMSTVTPYALIARSYILNAAGLQHLAVMELDVTANEGACGRCCYLMGENYAAMGQYVSACAWYEKLISSGGFTPQFISRCARMQVITGRIDDAETLLVKGIRCYPHSMELYIALAKIYRDSGRRDMALGTLLAAHTKGKFNRKVRQQLGITLNMMGYTRSAERYLRDGE